MKQFFQLFSTADNLYTMRCTKINVDWWSVYLLGGLGHGHYTPRLSLDTRSLTSRSLTIRTLVVGRLLLALARWSLLRHQKRLIHHRTRWPRANHGWINHPGHRCDVGHWNKYKNYFLARMYLRLLLISVSNVTPTIRMLCRLYRWGWVELLLGR